MALSTRRECYCRQPHGDPGSTCWTCQGRVGRSSGNRSLNPDHFKYNALEVFRANLNVSVGSDHRSSPVKRTYMEEKDPCHGGTFEGSDYTAIAGPGGYYQMISSKGREWVGTMAWGGSSSPSYARAGPDGVYGSGGKDGHAVAMYGSGSNFTAAIYGPGGQVWTKHSDGSTSRGKVRDEKQGRSRYSERKKKQKSIRQ